MGLLLVSASRPLPKGEKDRQWQEVGDGPKAIGVMLLGPSDSQKEGNCSLGALKDSAIKIR